MYTQTAPISIRSICPLLFKAGIDCEKCNAPKKSRGTTEARAVARFPGQQLVDTVSAFLTVGSSLPPSQFNSITPNCRWVIGASKKAHGQNCTDRGYPPFNVSKKDMIDKLCFCQGSVKLIERTRVHARSAARITDHLVV